MFQNYTKMAAVKVVVLLCVAVFSFGVQGSVVHNINTEQEQIKDVVTDALKLLEKLQEIVKNSVVNALKDIDGLLDQINHTAQDIVQNVEAALEAAIKPFLDAIQKLEDEAAQKAVDITDCIGNSVSDITNLPAHFLQNATTCVNTQVQKAQKYVNNIINDVNSTLDQVFDLGNQIQACAVKPLIQELTCLAGVTAAITADTLSLPLKITNDVAKIKLYVAKALPSLALCTGGEVAELVVEATGIVADVTECAIKKINGTTIIV